jgi:hypothetical protein
MSANKKGTEPFSCELTDYITQFSFCHCQERKLNGNNMLLVNGASRLIKRFTDQAKFWDNMINLSFENTPTHLEPPLHYARLRVISYLQSYSLYVGWTRILLLTDHEENLSLDTDFKIRWWIISVVTLLSLKTKFGLIKRRTYLPHIKQRTKLWMKWIIDKTLALDLINKFINIK